MPRKSWIELHPEWPQESRFFANLPDARLDLYLTGFPMHRSIGIRLTWTNNPDPMVSEAGMLDRRLNFRHVGGYTVSWAYGTGRSGIIGGRFCARLIDVALQTT